MIPIERSYVPVGNRLVHIRRAGKGPPILLLHQSPRSSAELEPLIRQLAGKFDVLAPDTPGNGLSDAIAAADHSTDMFADALAALLDVLGIERCGLYGYHTGAAIGASLAARHPGRIGFAVLNGVPAFDAAEQADIATHYLPTFRPQWDGSHLAWLWSRLREQTIFFPWYRTDPVARMRFDVPTPDMLMAAVRDFLHAGDQYRDAYGAAFASDGARTVASLRMPAAIVSTARDPLRPHLERIASGGTSVRVAEIASGDDEICRLIDEYAAMGDSCPKARPIIHTPADRSYVDVGCGALHVRRWGMHGRGKPLLLFHDIASSGAAIAHWGVRFGAERPVIAVDLPGCGDSRDVALPGSLTELIDGLESCSSCTDFPDVCDVAGIGFGAVIAHKLAERLPDFREMDALSSDCMTSHVADWPKRLQAEAAVFAPSEPSGAHLMRAWQRARDSYLFDPWYRTTVDSIRADGKPDTDRVHGDCVALVQGSLSAMALWKFAEAAVGQKRDD